MNNRIRISSNLSLEKVIFRLRERLESLKKTPRVATSGREKNQKNLNCISRRSQSRKMTLSKDNISLSHALYRGQWLLGYGQKEVVGKDVFTWRHPSEVPHMPDCEEKYGHFHSQVGRLSKLSSHVEWELYVI